MSQALFAAVNKMAHGVQPFTAPKKKNLRTISLVDGEQHTMPPYVQTKHHNVSAVAPSPPRLKGVRNHPTAVLHHHYVVARPTPNT